MKLYTFFRSSASYRVRIALNLKALNCEQVPIHLRRGGGEQFSATYKAINPQALVPALEDAGRILTQSLAIMEYLEERYPKPPLRQPIRRIARWCAAWRSSLYAKSIRFRTSGYSSISRTI